MGAGGASPALLPNGRTERDGETLCWRFHTVKCFDEEVCVPQAGGQLEAARPRGEEALEARASGSSRPNAADAGGALPWKVKGPGGRAGRKPPSGIARRGGGLSPPPRPPSHHPTVSSSIASIIYHTSWSFIQVAGKLKHILGGLYPALH